RRAAVTAKTGDASSGKSYDGSILCDSPDARIPGVGDVKTARSIQSDAGRVLQRSAQCACAVAAKTGTSGSHDFTDQAIEQNSANGSITVIGDVHISCHVHHDAGRIL